MATMQYLRYPVIGTGSGTVTSVGLSLPGSVFTVSGSPVTISGTLTGTFTNQAANTVFAGPTSGGPGTPAFRALVSADIPPLAYVISVTASAPLVSSGGQNPNISTTVGNLTDAGTDGITVTGGTGAVFGSGTSLSQHVADATHNGYLSSADWSTFNGKQAAGNYITALTGDATATGPGSVALTLATVNGNVGSFGSSTAIPSFTVNAKGLITAASTNVVIAPAGTLTGTTLAANVVSSSLTSVGTITTGVWNGTAVDAAHGGTGQTSLTANNVLLGNGTSPVQFVAPGTSGNILQSNGTTWQSVAYKVPTLQIFTAGSGTYTTPAGVLYLKIKLNGGGGGGGGSGSTGVTAGGTGGTTTFGSSFLTANGGTGGTAPPGGSGSTAAGGTATGGDINLTGGTGAGKPGGVNNAVNAGTGGSNPLGFGGPGSSANSTVSEDGFPGIGYGAGGGGASNNLLSTGGGGGGSGGYLEKIVGTPSASYAYSVGSAGSAGTAGTGGNAGGSGTSAIIYVEEHYQ